MDECLGLLKTCLQDFSHNLENLSSAFSVFLLYRTEGFVPAKPFRFL